MRYLSALPFKQQVIFIRKVKEENKGKFIIDDKKLSQNSELSTILNALSEKEILDYMQQIIEQIKINNKKAGLEIEENCSREEFIKKLSVLLLESTKDKSKDSMYTRMFIEKMIIDGLEIEEFLKNSFLVSREHCISFAHAHESFTTNINVENYFSLLSKLVADPESCFTTSNINHKLAIHINKKSFSFSNEESKILYEKLLVPYYEIIGLYPKKEQKFDVDAFASIKDRFDGYDEKYKITYTPEELSIVANYNPEAIHFTKMKI